MIKNGFNTMFNLKLKENRNRLKFDIEVGEFQSNINKNKKLIPSISAVYRVKNAE